MIPHDVHAALLAVSLYVPAPHCSHSDVVMCSPENPVLHTHAVDVVLPAGDVLEAGHPSHATSVVQRVNVG